MRAVALALDGADKDALAAEALLGALGLSAAKVQALVATPPPMVAIGSEGLLRQLAGSA